MATFLQDAEGRAWFAGRYKAPAVDDSGSGYRQSVFYQRNVAGKYSLISSS